MSTQGPWTVEAANPGWAVKRPDSSVIFMLRKTEAEARKACDEANARWRLDRIRDAAPDMLTALKPLASAAEAFNWVNDKNVNPDEVFLWSESRGSSGIVTSISVGDVLRAAAAIAKAEGR